MHIIADKSDPPLAYPAPKELSDWRPTVLFLSQTEVHVYALSIAGSMLLSFFPFLIVMLTLIRDVFHMPAAERALFFALKDYFPSDFSGFIIRNLLYNLTKANHGKFQIVSVVLLLFTANGIFEPLEVALNRAWNVKNRSYLHNQILSFLMVLLCGGLALGSVLLTSIRSHSASDVQTFVSIVFFRIAAVPVTVLSLFLVYWMLPNREVPARRVAPVAIVVGLALEGMKYAFMFAWHWIDVKLYNEYGPFEYAVSIMIFGLIAGLLVLAGAEWSAREQTIAAKTGEPA